MRLRGGHLSTGMKRKDLVGHQAGQRPQPEVEEEDVAHERCHRRGASGERQRGGREAGAHGRPLRAVPHPSETRPAQLTKTPRPTDKNAPPN
jgi:hypothetical protein